MGVGLEFKVKNAAGGAVAVSVTDSHCMYDDGHEGSDLRPFKSANMPDRTYLPTSGNARVESKGSSSDGDLCATDTSHFTLSFLYEGAKKAATIHFVESGTLFDRSWSWEIENSPDIAISYGNGVVTLTPNF